VNRRLVEDEEHSSVLLQALAMHQALRARRHIGDHFSMDKMHPGTQLHDRVRRLRESGQRGNCEHHKK
jgi:hypothetical protein